MPPHLAVGDGCLRVLGGFGRGVALDLRPLCWVHKAANVLNELPKSIQVVVT